MKVIDFIKFLMDFDMNTEIVVSTGDTFDDIEDLNLSWGGPNSCDGDTKFDAEYIFIDSKLDKSEV